MYHKRHFCFVSNFLGSFHIYGGGGRNYNKKPLPRIPSVPLLCALPASRPLSLFRRMLSGIPSSLCISRILARAHNTNNPAISDRAVSFSSSVLFAGDGVCGTVIDISGLAAKPDTRADYRLRHHLCLFYYWLLIHLFHNNYCLLC